MHGGLALYHWRGMIGCNSGEHGACGVCACARDGAHLWRLKRRRAGPATFYVCLRAEDISLCGSGLPAAWVIHIGVDAPLSERSLASISSTS